MRRIAEAGEPGRAAMGQAPCPPVSAAVHNPALIPRRLTLFERLYAHRDIPGQTEIIPPFLEH
ncbi:hypothetical protein [Azospirillum argentinense]|uniref:Uncharacterized protein n=1 Tax=Azospirillum brasilense TaxID=192 RepID=A0A4D8QAG2_AZOBR|nr:hypothetical protein [Azospirillum argentinense]QCO07355.1 hypothetical protein D3867_36365 [Azospirillum argentinense]